MRTEEEIAALEKKWRRQHRREWLVGAAVIVTLASLALWLVTMLTLAARADTYCTRAGYPATSITVTGRSYCMRRVFGTDEVVPLSKVRR